MSSFAEVRIVAERLEFTEFGPQDAAAVKALVEAGGRTSLPPGAPSQRPEVDAWLADGVHRHRREGGGVHLMMLERSSGELAGSISLFKTDWEARSSEVGYGLRCAPGSPRQRLRERGHRRRGAEQAGFQRESTLRRAQLEDDGLHDLAVFSLLHDDPAV